MIIRWGDYCGRHRPGKAWRRARNLRPGSCAWACHRSRRRRLPRCCQGLALGILGARNNRWCAGSSVPRSLAGDVRFRYPRKKGSSSPETNKQQWLAFPDGSELECQAAFLTGYSSSLQDSRLLTDRQCTITLHGRGLWISYVSVRQLCFLTVPWAVANAVWTEYLLFSTFTKAFQDQYGFSTSIVGLTFLGLGVGNLIGLAVISSLLDKILKDRSKVTEANPDGERKPEYRLIPLEWSSLSLPVGLFLYGWTIQYQVHWIVPLIGTAIYGFGQLAVFLCIMSYLIDAFGMYAASALAANIVVRSIFGAVLPLAGARMYTVLGYGWGNSLLGFIALALVPIPILLNRHGETLRKRFDASRI